MTFAPLLVYDANTNEGVRPATEAWRFDLCAWLLAHGIDECRTHRLEFYLLDAPFVRVFQYAHDADGHVYLDRSTRRIAERTPFDVLTTSPAPRPEDYR